MNVMTGHMREGAARGPSDAEADGVRVLKLGSIVKTFGGFTALDGVDFDLRAGEIHALLGENGAGKSSLMNIVAGIYTPDSGTVEVRGRSTHVAGPADARALGVGMVHQHYKLVKPFTAVENIALTVPAEGGHSRNMARIRQAAREAADRLGFELDLERPVGQLSIPEQQRVEIIKILVAGASIIILDEPTAVLTDEEAERLFQAMRSLARQGHAVVLVTHKLHEALGHADRITVMRGGAVIDTVAPGDVDAETLTTMIVGSRIVEVPQRAETVGKPVLMVRRLSRTGPGGQKLLRDLDFDVRSGEIYGVAGVGGNGQSELVDALTGLVAAHEGKVFLDGSGDVTGATPDRLRRMGVGCIPADRQSYALAGDLTVSDNYAIGGVLEGRYGSAMFVDRRRIGQDTACAVARFQVLGVRGPHQKAALLSGGNAQKLVIAREFSASPRLIIAHSPSRGLDVRASAAVHQHLRDARDRGAGVILLSEDLDEVLLLCDRIGVMSRGAIVAEFTAPADRQAIGKAMVGHG